ncbi:MAG: HlyD family efflux transporter periplasmic adaptor subunit [Sandaracinaceae bacterium]
MSRNRRIGIGAAVALVLALVGLRLAAIAQAPTVRLEDGVVRPAIVARAEVVPAGGVFHVLPEQAGRVTSVSVRVGDRVRRDDELAAYEPSGPGASTATLLDDTVPMVSPIDGVVLARHLEPGDLLSTLLAPAQPPFEIADDARTELRIEIEERDAAAVTVGQAVRIGELETHIERLAPRIERREHPFDDVASRARADVRAAWAPVPDGAELVLGQHVEVRILREEVHAEVVAPRAVIAVVDGRAVVRVRDGLTVTETPVTLGATDDERVAIEGVAAGVEVLAEP